MTVSSGYLSSPGYPIGIRVVVTDVAGMDEHGQSSLRGLKNPAGSGPIHREPLKVRMDLKPAQAKPDRAIDLPVDIVAVGMDRGKADEPLRVFSDGARDKFVDAAHLLGHGSDRMDHKPGYAARVAALRSVETRPGYCTAIS